MSDLMSKLGKMAALNNIAIVLTCQTVTRLRTGASAILLPALSSLEWDNGISTQLVIFRDWPPSDKVKDARWQRVRFVGAIKVNGALLGGDGGVGTVVPFTIEKSGLSEINISSAALSVPPLSSPHRSLKRSFDEIADSDGEAVGSDDEYGWADEDQMIAAEGLVDVPIDLTKADDGDGAVTAESVKQVASGAAGQT
ncbi:hypothetical protein LTS18_003267 [Coniosporium uncinatum]|uniref:Uncharacterized protein n=1 Tax=Coniosporium uncinatum TaxID=93489 RepID=A0ACC3D7B6_9PEZI|nr:hypothetical protein LTS18_003267 [Coniosporium uncinatum]